MTWDLEADVCIVGAGPAGAIVARDLAARGIDVLLLESGPRLRTGALEVAQRRIVRGEPAFPPDDPRVDEHRVAGDHPFPLTGKRMRAVGGASLHWEGYAMRFRDGDFALATRHGLADDWPLGYDDLEPWYDRVERELGVAGGGDDACRRTAAFPMPPFPFSHSDRIFARACAAMGIRMQALPQARNSVEYGGRPACRSCGTCHVCPIGAKATVDVTHVAPAEATGHARVLDRAHVVALECDHGGAVRGVRFRDGGWEVRTRAELVVLAAGAIENARLCLASACPAHPDGVANASGLLGHYLMSPPVVDFTATVDEPMYPYRTGISTAISRQFEDPPERATAGSFWMEFRNRAGGTPAEIALASGLTGRALQGAVRERFGRQAGIRVWVEQLPALTNGVRLERDVVDAFGRQAPRVTYGVGPHERQTLARSAAIVHALFAALGATDVRQSPIMHGGIMTGTHRMGSDPRTSVVDATQRAHDVPNLYLVGAGSFVTGAAAPPTLTLAALAARTADAIGGGHA